MKLGVLVIGRKRPGFDQEWNAIMRERCVAALLALGHTCVGAESPVIDDASIAERLRQMLWVELRLSDVFEDIHPVEDVDDVPGRHRTS